MNKKKNNNKKTYNKNDDEPRIKSTNNKKKTKRHFSKENLKNLAQGNMDYDEYMEIEDWK
ncbi:MAG TPA: hypothetical protein DF712_19050 [Balneola sp.]|nr:hypothetical protein [Balneola sp.]